MGITVSTILVLAVILVMGCGGDDNDNDSSSPGASQGEVSVPGGVIDEQTFRAFVRRVGFTGSSGGSSCAMASSASTDGVWDLLAEATSPSGTPVPLPEVTPRAGQPPKFDRIKEILIEECARR